MSSDLIGKKISGYEIQKVLGRGGMGVVYKAVESTLDRSVAIKVLPAHLAENKEFIGRFYREARAAAQLNHPNVVTIHRVGEEDGHHYIAMEFLKGREVTDLIKEKGQVDVELTMKVCRQVAEALAAAHEMGILHRDIKPQNIMIDELGRVKVMDFGIAKIKESGSNNLTMTGQLLGTPAYMSPEQCQGTSSDHRSDIYSLGVVMYQMLAGRVPFTGETPLAVIRKIVEEPIPVVYGFNQDVPEPVVRVLHKALAKDPEDRYGSAHALSADITRFLEGKEVQAPAADMDGGGESATLVGGQAPSYGGRVNTQILQTRAMAQSRSRLPIAIVVIAVLFLGVAIALTMLNKKTEVEKPPVGKPIAGVPGPGPENPQLGTPPPDLTPAATEAPPTPRPNANPTAEIKLSDDEAIQGDKMVATFSYTDPDEDTLSTSYSIDDKGWKKAGEDDQLDLSTLSPGEHTLKFRAKDDFGGEVIAEASFKILKRPEPTKAPSTPAPATPMKTPEPMPATPAPMKTPPPSSDTPAPAAGPAGQLFVIGQHDSPVRGVAISADGRSLLSGGDDGNAYIWDIEGKSKKATLAGHKGSVYSVAFSRDGKLALTGGSDSQVCVWDAASGSQLRCFANHPKTWNNGPNKVLAVGFSPDGQFALSATEDSTVCKWESGSGSEVKRTEVAAGGASALAFSPDGNSVASCSIADKGVRIWEIAGGREVHRLEPAKGTRNPRATIALAFSPDGRFLAAGGQDKKVTLYDAGSGTYLRDMAGHENWVNAVAFSPKGQFLVSGARDNMVIVWDVESGTRLEEFRNNTESVYALAFSPDSTRAVSGGADKSLRLFAISN